MNRGMSNIEQMNIEYRRVICSKFGVRDSLFDILIVQNSAFVIQCSIF